MKNNEYCCPHPSTSKNNGSALSSSSSCVAQWSDFHMAAPATDVAHKVRWLAGRLVLLSRFPPLLLVLQLVALLFLTSSDSLDASSHGELPTVPSCLGRCLSASYPVCRHPWIVVLADMLGSVPWSIHRTGGLLMHPSSMLYTCPSQHRRHWQSIRCMLRELAVASNLAFVTLSCQIMPRIQQRQQRWNFSWLKKSCIQIFIKEILSSYGLYCNWWYGQYVVRRKKCFIRQCQLSAYQ